jgi:lipopolysaccharide/colanic/teichoic acid biosynthesis glycosyltransferase
MKSTQRFLKRGLDLFLALLGLLILSPVLLICSIAIKLSDGGPVLFKQVRLTLNHKKFELLKFRSMVVDAEKDCGAVLSSKDDERITPVGKIMRRLRLDELPQLLNILKGEMSFVGPRPERPELAEEYRKEMPEFDYRLKVKAGLTGYAQIVGRYNTTPHDKLKMDLMYIAGYSILEDIKLILQTFKILLIKSSTEGVDKPVGNPPVEDVAKQESHNPQ